MSFIKNVRFLAISFSMIEITCWNVPMKRVISPESRLVLLLHSVELGFAFASFSGTALAAFVLCCATGVFVFASNVGLLDCFVSSGFRCTSLQSSCCSCGVSCALLRNWDVDSRVNVLKQWDIHRSRCLLNHKHLSLHHYQNVRSVLFEILLDCGKELLFVAAACAC